LLPAIAEDAESCVSLSSDADAAVSAATHPITWPTADAHHGVLKNAIKKCADPGSAPAYHTNPGIALALDPGTIFERDATDSCDVALAADTNDVSRSPHAYCFAISIYADSVSAITAAHDADTALSRNPNRTAIRPLWNLAAYSLDTARTLSNNPNRLRGNRPLRRAAYSMDSDFRSLCTDAFLDSRTITARSECNTCWPISFIVCRFIMLCHALHLRKRDCRRISLEPYHSARESL
jgi:hypothetical protein